MLPNGFQLWTGQAIGKILVVQRRPVSGKVDLGKRGTAGQQGRRTKQGTEIPASTGPDHLHALSQAKPPPSVKPSNAPSITSALGPRVRHPRHDPS